ncbi:unnamed protein product [Cylindrotheca closterium]|uniref:Prefoldin subunit 3 n=1 Tax=Cylindrotheca closterium TaxID=2856 RepID=A0AAD2CU72_9STRA|nr:unnamed protein product [Cylindrotheca closterium]
MEEEDSVAIRDKMAEYSKFLEDILKPEWEDAKYRLDLVRTQIHEYRELQQTLIKQQKDLTATIMAGKEPAAEEKMIEADVDLGMNKTVYCRAVAPASDILEKIFVHVGMNYHVEFRIDEALIFVSKRIKYLEDNPLAAKQAKFDEVDHHLQSAEVIFKQLSTEIQRGF